MPLAEELLYCLVASGCEAPCTVAVWCLATLCIGLEACNGELQSFCVAENKCNTLKTALSKLAFYS
jgi:hypothetical protein